MDTENASIANTTCTIAGYRGALVHGSLPIAICIIFILSFIQRTKKERRPGSSGNLCRDLFSLIYPIDLFDNHDRLPHCLAFGASSSLVLDLIFGDYQSYFFGFEIPGWSKILVGCIVTVEIAIDCFPFFACITCKSRLVSYGMGFFYLIAWFVMLIYISVSCEKRDETGQPQPYPIIVPQIPVLVCILLLTVYFLAMFITIIIQRHKGIVLTKEERLYKTHAAIYIKNLLNKPKEVVYMHTGWRAKLVKMYKPHPGFIYPTRVLMPCFVSIVTLFQVAFWIIPLGLGLIDTSIGVARGLARGQYQNETQALDAINGILDQANTGLHVSWTITSVLAIIIPVMYIPIILKNYRKHLLSMWSGKYDLPTNVRLQSVQSIVGSLKYIGFQVAVFLTGYVFIQVVLFIVFGGFTFYVLACIWNFQSYFVEIFLELVLPSVIIGMSIMSSQNLFVKLFFVQDKLNPNDNDRPLALQRRVWFLIYCYVTMFLNLLYGLILAVIRVIIGLIITIFMLPRIDRPIWVPGFGDKDLVYTLYVGNLLTENAHSNPILVTFCHLMVFDILRPQRKRQKLERLSSSLVREGLINNAAPKYTDLENPAEEKEPQHLLKYFRWHLAYTLINNPSLIELRKSSAILPVDHQVVLADGEAKFVSAGEGKGGNMNAQMLPHIVEVMKRQNLEKKRSLLSQSSQNAIDTGLIVLEEAPEYLVIHKAPIAQPAVPLTPVLPNQDPAQTTIQSGLVDGVENHMISGPGGEGPHTTGFESKA